MTFHPSHSNLIEFEPGPDKPVGDRVRTLVLETPRSDLGATTVVGVELRGEVE